MKVPTLLLLLIVFTCARAQEVPLGKHVVVGDTTAQDSARIDLTVLGGGPRFNLFTTDFTWNNGPPSEPAYQNHTMNLGFNQNASGVKVVPGVVNFGWAFEHKFSSGGSFISEWHWNWCNPDGSICRRPIGGSIDYLTGNYDSSIQGRLTLTEQDGITPTIHFNPGGAVDMRPAPNAMIIFRNNAMGTLYMKADGSNSILPINVDPQDRVVVSPGGYQVVINAPANVQTVDASGEYKVDGQKVVGNRCAPIPDSNGSNADNKRAINALLNCLRTNHGSVAP